MRFSEIEQRIDPIIRDYIKNHCYERVFDRTETKVKEKTATGTKYISSYIYKHVFDEKKYKKSVRDWYLQHVEPLEKQIKPKTKRKKREIGANITQEEFFRLIFREHFDHRRGESDQKGRKIYLRSFLANINADKHLIENILSSHNLEKVIKQAKKYGYFTPNMFISHQFFTKEMLTLLGVIVLDFDLDDAHMIMTKEEIFKYIKSKIKAEPAMIWDTKTQGNYQAAILINPMTGTPKSVHLYEQIVKEMCLKLGNRVDAACVNANHLFSVGQNNKRTGRLTRKYNETVYDINDFRWLLNERDERRRKEERSDKVLDFTKEAVRRHPAIQALFSGQDIHWRDHACFTLGLVMRFLEYSQEECENYILTTWQPTVDNVQIYGDHFTRNEALKCIRHAYSDRYKSFHSHWVEVCTGMPCDLRGYFRFSSYESKGIYQTGNKKIFMDYLKANNGIISGTKDSIAETLRIIPKTLKNILEQMKKDGELYYETKRGRGAVTTFVLQEQLEMVIDRDKIKPIEDEMAQIFELEEAMEEIRRA